MNDQQQYTPPPASGLSIAAMVLGILSVLGGLVFTGIPALILGYNARAQVHRSGGQVGGLGLAWTGIITGWISVVISLLLAILAVASGFLFARAASVAVSSASSLVGTAHLKNAASDFFTEYRKYPITGSISATTDTKVKSDSSLMNTLMASGPGNTTNNPRGIVFYTMTATPSFGGGTVAGVVTDSAGNNELLDNAGNHFHLIFDTNGDGQIDDPFTGTPVSESILVWSNGTDGIGGTADDKKSW